MVYDIAVIVKVQASSYEQAIELAGEFIDTADYDVGNDADVSDIIDAAVILNFEEDNVGQRVLYLPGVDGGGSEESDVSG